MFREIKPLSYKISRMLYSIYMARMNNNPVDPRRVGAVISGRGHSYPSDMKFACRAEYIDGAAHPWVPAISTEPNNEKGSFVLIYLPDDAIVDFQEDVPLNELKCKEGVRWGDAQRALSLSNLDVAATFSTTFIVLVSADQEWTCRIEVKADMVEAAVAA